MKLLVGRGCIRKWLRTGICGLAVLCMISTMVSLFEFKQPLSVLEYDSIRVHRQQDHSTLINPGQSQSIPRTNAKWKKETKRDDRWREFYHRRKTMTKACFESHSRSKGWLLLQHSFLDNLILDSKTNWLYCSVLKAGSTFWKRVIAVTSGLVNESDPIKLDPIKANKYVHSLVLNNRKFSLSQIDALVFKATSFMFSRNPYTRLFSCYIDKIFTPRPFYRYLREAILRVVGRKRNDLCALDVTFAEFVNYVVLSVQSRSGVDNHFVPMNELCRPCKVQFDFVGKMETFQDDAEYILGKMNAGISLEFTKRQVDLDAIGDMVQSVFAEKNDSKECIKFGNFLSKIWQKSIIRGILSRNETMPDTFLTNPNVLEKQFHSAMLKAYERSAADKGKSSYKKQALIEAFKTVSKEVLSEYHELFKADFEIFGYKMYPDSIFP